MGRGLSKEQKSILKMLREKLETSGSGSAWMSGREIYGRIKKDSLRGEVAQKMENVTKKAPDEDQLQEMTEFWIQRQGLPKYTKQKQFTYRRALESLVRRGFVLVQHCTGKHNLYKIRENDSEVSVVRREAASGVTLRDLSRRLRIIKLKKELGRLEAEERVKDAS